MISRRSFLKGVSGAVAAAGVIHSLLTWAGDDSAVAIPGKDGMIVRSARFFDLETPPEFFDSWITPVPHFFVRNHMHEPSALDAATWELKITGEVEKPLTLTYADLVRMDPHSVTNALECAGVGGAFYHPHVPGVQWQKGAVGTARFSGPHLGDILQRAGVKPTGKHVMFRGLDEVPGKVPPFIRSVPIEKASDSDTLIAVRMNGEPLTKHHGFPARAVVPGWIGAASCKWLSEIKVVPKEFDVNNIWLKASQCLTRV
jgi:DMSO/TMAO reductase YedYZ molybdopterin-dependent catalytic subunit